MVTFTKITSFMGRRSFGMYIHSLVLLGVLSSPAKAQPPAAALGQMVDKFTGDLNYSLPLLVVPGPNGESFPITLQYQNGGIGVDQAASEVGLGWSIPIGEIVRQVNGRPDDALGESQVSTVLQKTNDSGIITCAELPSEELQVYGPVHFKEVPVYGDPRVSISCNTCVGMDVYASRTGVDEARNSAFEFPDYDGYSMVGPLISGQLGMHLFDYVSIFQKPKLGNSFSHIFNGINWDFRPTEKRPILVSYDADDLSIVAPIGERDYRGWPTDENSSVFPDPPAVSSLNHGPGLRTDITPNVAKTGNFIRYFTNREIHAHHTDENSTIDGFIDWRAYGDYPSRIDEDEFPPDGIGAIQVVDANGFTFHFSLPVHARGETRYMFNLRYDPELGYDLFPPSATTTYTQVDRTSIPGSHATTWKLTAVTGPDFVDDGDGSVDDDDTGYWIRMDYAKWTDHFATRYPIFGYQADLTQDGKVFFGDSRQIYSSSPEYRKTGTTIKQESEIYYLNRISTATHSAMFIHDVRFDEHSISTDPKPRLRLSEIILIRNSMIPVGAFPSSTEPLRGPFGEHSTTGVAIENVYNSAQVTTTLRDNSLASVRLVQDYSLAKRLQNNINSGYAPYLMDETAAREWCDVIYYDAPSTAVTPSDHANSGKLTLKSVRLLGMGAIQTTPTHDFSYYDAITVAGSATDPLDSKPAFKDHFGHYKCDYDPLSKGGYTTETSAARVHAWGLKSITDPNGAVVNIDYESDTYSKVIYGNLAGTPRRFYYIKELSPWITGGAENDSRIYFYDKDAPHDLENSASNPRIIRAYAHLLYSYEGSPHAPMIDLRGVDIIESTNSIGTWTMDGHALVPEGASYYEGYFVCIDYREQLGGGVRVKALTLTDESNTHPYKLSLEYESGTCPAEPDPYDGYERELGSNGFTSYQSFITMDRAAGDRHAPTSTVGYTLAREILKDANNEVIGGTEYEFNSTAVGLPDPYYYETADFGHEVAECEVPAATYGRLLRSSVLDKEKNAISRTTYQYMGPPSVSIEEAFHRAGAFGNTVNGAAPLYPIPSIASCFVKRLLFRKLTSIVHEENGTKVTTYFSNADPNTGAPLTTTVLNDNTAVTRSTTNTPVYTTEPSLGPKWQDASNKNILTPTIETTSSVGKGSKSDWTEEHAIRKYDATIGYFDTEVTTTQWAPTASYTKNGTAWKYVGRPTLFDPRMRVLEQKDMAEGYSASRLSLSGEYTIADAGNCDHASFTYCSFERSRTLDGPSTDILWFDGEVSNAGDEDVVAVTNPSGITPHSGKGVVKVLAASSGPVFHSAPSSRSEGTELIQTGLLTGRTYRAIAWVHESSPVQAGLLMDLSGSHTASVHMNKNDAEALHVGEWIRLEARVTVPDGFTTSSPGQGLKVRLTNSSGAQPAYFDDLLLYPVDATIAGACWDEARGLMVAGIGPEGFITRYVHAPDGQVIEVHQETENGVRLVERSEVGFKRSF